MRPLHHKIFGLSWLTITWFFRRVFWMLFLITLGFSIGLAVGIYKQFQDISLDDVLKTFVLGIILPTTFILWLGFLIAHRIRSAKEEKHFFIEYLEELKDHGVISEESFIREKEKIMEN
ncbi:MAG TPA: hypothetical protein VN026_07670 [Bacteroidia bacterium]|jgi:hypothetical protein|nr:hypothetical protein [Bacteroidia bacterium]